MMFSSFIIRTYWLVWALCGHDPSFAFSTIPDAVEYVEAGIVVWLLQIVW